MKGKRTCPRCGSRKGQLIEMGISNGYAKARVGVFIRCDGCYLASPIAPDEQSALFWWRAASGEGDEGGKVAD